MALVIEDGSIVANANSYVTLEESRAYAVARGETLPTVDTTLESYLINAMDYLESKRSKYQGYKTDPDDQELQWPRYDVYIDGNELASDAIPKELKNAQIQLAIDVNNGIDLQPSTDEQFITKEKVGPIETEYSEKLQSGTQPKLTIAENLLAPLYRTLGVSLVSVRV